jgi:nicotinate phosphoribosyltransferase
MITLENPIIQSMIDDDWYKFTMGSVVFHLFPRAVVTYEFINRGNTPFPKGFDVELRKQIQYLTYLKLTGDEAKFLKSIPYIRPTYVEWLEGYRMDESEVDISQIGGDLYIFIKGPWYRTIFWEVKLMAIISELYFAMTGHKLDENVVSRMKEKGKKLNDAGCHWIDFGTRRRFSYEVQDHLVNTMRKYEGFLGTSNPHLAHKYGLKPQGTYAHECVMAMQSLYCARISNKMWMKHWSDHFDGNVGIGLTDTITTDVFLDDFNTYEARLFDGLRQDSGDPIKWGYKVLTHYGYLGVSAKDKRLVFSDGLDVDTYIIIHRTFCKAAQIIGGIGTYFTNDVEGAKPLNMVIKMTTADFGKGPVNIVKLSDSEGKYTGDPNTIKRIKEELGIE